MRAADDEQGLALRLAAALASYADPEENPAPRLLAARAIDGARVVRSKRLKRWSIGGLVSIAACLLVVAFVASLHHPHPHMRIAVAPRLDPERRQLLAEARSAPPAAAVRHAAAHRGARARQAALHRLGQFPTPQPLTAQERLMLAFVSTATPATQQLVARAVEPSLPIREAESGLALTGSSLSEQPETTGAPHEEPR